jgi:hypothetical protein
VVGAAKAGAPLAYSQLTPHGRDIYHALKAVVENHEQGGPDAHRH